MLKSYLSAVGWKEGMILLVLFFLALTVRLAYVTGIESAPFSDMADYERLAINLLEGKGYTYESRPTAYRPPGYPAFLASVYLFTGRSPISARVVQSFFGALTCIGVYFLLRKLFFRFANSSGGIPRYLGPFTGAFFLVFYDEWIFYCGQLLSETLFVFLLCAWFIMLLHWNSAKKPRNSVDLASLSLGLLGGVVTLVRPSGLFILLPAFTMVWWKTTKVDSPSENGAQASGKALRTRLFPVILFLGGWSLFCVPWVIRNSIHFGSGAGLSTNTGVNFYIGHNPYFGYWSTGDKNRIREMTDLNEVDESGLFLRLGLKHIIQKPLITIKNTGKKVWYLFFEPWRPWPREGQALLDPWNLWSERHIGPFKPWPWFGHGRELPPEEGFPFPLFAWDVPAIFLVLVGIIVAVLLRFNAWALYAGMAGHIVSCLIFFARARFRVPLGILFALFIGLVFYRAADIIVRRYQSREEISRETVSEG